MNKNYCPNCNKEIDNRSKNCISCSLLGRKHSQNTIAKIRKANLGYNNPMFGRSGDKNPNYIDGRSLRIKEWIRKVKERDNYTCQICERKKSEVKRLDSHHIKSQLIYPELTYILSNGITLCRSCHNIYEQNTEMLLEKFNNKLPILSGNVRIRYPEFFDIANHSIIDDFCYFSVQLKIGKYSHIASGCSIAGGKQYKFTLGDFCSLSSGVKVWCSSNDFVNDLIILNPNVDLELNMCSGNVTIDNYCGIGANSVIMPNNHIPEGVAIGGLSWVPANSIFEPWSVYAGIPIKKIKDRNKKRILNQVKILQQS